jgi:hypothetical protein
MANNISQKQKGAYLLAEQSSAASSKCLDTTALPTQSLLGTTPNCVVLLALTDL